MLRLFSNPRRARCSMSDAMLPLVQHTTDEIMLVAARRAIIALLLCLMVAVALLPFPVRITTALAELWVEHRSARRLGFASLCSCYSFGGELYYAAVHRTIAAISICTSQLRSMSPQPLLSFQATKSHPLALIY